MKILKLVGIVLAIAFAAIQFIRPAKNIAADGSPQHIVNIVDVPAEIRTILDNACADCHSDNTRYPWYAEVQPVGWLLERDVMEGKKHFNMSQFGAGRSSIQAHKLEEIETEVGDEEMPPAAYQWMHPEAKLTAEQRSRLIEWTNAARNQIKARNLVDSVQQR